MPAPHAAAARVATSGLVSVVIAARNAAPWIGAALYSVARQEYHPIEVIVVDDGSTDGTAEIAAAFASTFPATVVARQGRGPSGARNDGLAAAAGEFVQFLDADDLLAPGKIARQVALLRETGADVAWGAFDEVEAWSTLDAPVVRRCLQAPLDVVDMPRALIEEDGFVQLGAALFCRTPVVEGIGFDESIHVVEDVRYLVQLAIAGARFVRDEGGATVYWRHHSSPARASSRDVADFADAIAGNAALVHAAPLPPATTIERRSEVVVRCLLAAAEILAARGDRRLWAVLSLLRRVDPRYRRRLRMPHRALLPLLGFARTFALAEWVKRRVTRPAAIPTLTRARV